MLSIVSINHCNNNKNNIDVKEVDNAMTVINNLMNNYTCLANGPITLVLSKQVQCSTIRRFTKSMIQMSP